MVVLCARNLCWSRSLLTGSFKFRRSLCVIKLHTSHISLMEENSSTTEKLKKMRNEHTAALPPVDQSVQLDRDRFKRTASMLVVGLLCNAQMKSTCSKLKPYFPNYIRIPKLTHTYFDSANRLRKLMLIQPPETTGKDSTTIFTELKSLDVDARPTPCSLHVIDNSSTDTDRAVNLTNKNDPQVEENPTGPPSEAFASRDPPVLSLDRLVEIQSPGTVQIQLSYDNFSLDEVLKQLLPHHVAPVTGFTIMGHVAHFNLKPDALPYRHLIGQAVLDKVANIRTVIHKAANIASDFRTFELDLMAGEPDYVTSVIENQLVFHLDVSKVYWNSRLGTEHARVVADLTECHSLDSESKNPKTSSPAGRVIVYDVFAGVGPFSIPAARRGCRVFANDLNPASYEWLLKNVQANRSSKRPLDNITCYNLDGREFIRKVVLPHYWSSVEDDRIDSNTDDASSTPLRYVVIMNLPALAPDFLDAFLLPQSADELLTPNHSGSGDNVLANNSVEKVQSNKRHRPALPLSFYCYCFVRRQTESEETIKQRIAHALHVPAHEATALFARSPPDGSGPVIYDWRFRFVRNVAPFKDMFCLEFQLVLNRPETQLEHALLLLDARATSKKIKLEDKIPA